MRGVYAVYTNPRGSGVPGAPGLRLIEQFALLMVILFISLELSPRVCLHQRLAVPAAVFGQGITLMDGELGGGRASGEEGAGLSWARPLTLGGKETCVPAIGSFGLRRGGGWRCLFPGGSYLSSLKADSKLEVVSLGCAHINK